MTPIEARMVLENYIAALGDRIQRERESAKFFQENAAAFVGYTRERCETTATRKTVDVQRLERRLAAIKTLLNSKETTHVLTEA